MADQSSRRKRRYEEDDSASNNCVRSKKNCTTTRPNEDEHHQTETSQSQEVTVEAGNDQYSTDILHINKLSNLLNHVTDSNTVIQKLLLPRFGFLGRLERGTKNIKLTEMLLKVIAISCRATDQNSLLKFLCHVNGSKFITSDVPSYLNQLMTTHENVEDKTEILDEIVQILNCLVSRFPRKSLQVITLSMASIQYICRSKEITISLDELEARSKSARKSVQNAIPTRDEEKVERCLISVEDFKWLSTSPTCRDITGNGDPYLRKNKIFGRYENVNDYLDVQFRLLREDLIRPLREGLSELLEIRRAGGNKKSKCLLKVYHKLEFLSWRCSDNGVIYKIRFDTSRLRHVRWGTGKRLKFGSLVCLSKDQFKTMLIGTIAESKAENLVKGITFLSFDNERSQILDIEFNCFYEMIESPTYYEAYKNALNVLQNLSDRTLPFQKYLLNHPFDEISPPKYLVGRGIRYDFSCLTGCNYWFESVESDESYERRVSALDTDRWPSAERLGLDASQYAALKSALTSEFAVIQGPPGTGKTFIGVIIVQLLLANRRQPLKILNRTIFDSFALFKGPIMIVCYTNHALDQFLEEIFDRIDHFGYEIVRLGGRCSSDNVRLKRCNLNSIIMHHSKHTWSYAKRKVSELKDHCMRAAAFIELAREEILHEEYLKTYMFDFHFATLVRNRDPRSPSVLLDWLDDGRGNSWFSSIHRMHDRIPENRVSDEQECFEFDERDDGRRGAEVDHSESEKDFQRIKEEVRKSLFVNLSFSQSCFIATLQTLRNIRGAFNESELYAPYDVWLLRHKDRWRLYNYWVQQAVGDKMSEWTHAFQEYTRERLNLENEQMAEKVRVLEEADVIAMTTTGAAQNSEILKRVKPRIVIVEEAAEVLESHVITSLTEGCEHLILIGDHLQLRPKTSDDLLGKRYRLQVSLFERMLLNGKRYETLTIQHRMRPEISKLLVPHIYRSLQNHQKVNEYEDIMGVLGNVFFVDHSFPENSVDDIRSHSNEREAAFLAEFCKYLVNVGYESSTITVLTAYTGQLLLLRKHLPKKDGVHVTAIDNYQGEENDIILLSLVRSNTRNQAGFLRISNRICVALSRARKGLYIVGNAGLLRDASPLWRDILDSLNQDERLVDGLPLGCRKHPKQATHVQVGGDFRSVPPYGCSNPCDYRLDCGHSCGKKCHPFDQKHENYECWKPCSRSCPEGHMCQKYCFQPCGQCEVIVERTLSRCQHTVQMHCFMSEDDYECWNRCSRVNSSCPEGHMCGRYCHEFCGRCDVLVERTLSRCQHTVKMKCFMSEANYECQEPCRKTCELGHQCKKKCFDDCGECKEPVKRILERCQHEVTIACFKSNALDNVRCMVKVERTLTECGHVVQIPCWILLDSHRCQEPCKKVCQFGHKCPKKCHEDCGDCHKMMKKNFPFCQHTVTLPCHEPLENHLCKRRCEKKCSMGHQCRNMCHKPCDDCETLVLKTLNACGHEVEVACFKDPAEIRCDKPCEKFCSFGHRCPLKCGESCGECCFEVPVTFSRCGHLSHRKCHQDPEEAVCQQPCEKSLRCGHACQEICGAEECTVRCKVAIKRHLPCGHYEIIRCFEDPSQVENPASEHDESIDACCTSDATNEILEGETHSDITADHAHAIPRKPHGKVQHTGCSNVCGAKLPCGHLCRKICQDCCESGHGVCEAKCNKYHRLCSHKCDRICGHPKQSCSYTCSSTCRHSSLIIHSCGASYVACQRPCLWKCPHYSCEEPCGRPCIRPPCDEPCGNVMNCGHNCVGLCGEPCPALCRTCNGPRFHEIEQQLRIKLTEESRFLVLKPCSHVVECKFMDVWVERRMNSPPYQLQGSKFLDCPVCKKGITDCPRYSRQMKQYEMHLNMAKTRIKDSQALSNSISASLASNHLGRNINVTLTEKNHRLGGFYISFLTRRLLKFLPICEQPDATKQHLSQIEMKFQGDLSEDKELSSVDILNLYRIYIELQVFRLKNYIRGPKLRKLEECENMFRRLPPLDSDPEKNDHDKLWKVIDKVNEKLSQTFSRHERKDDIDNYILHLNQCFDLELNASCNSHWFCCTKGHVYSCEEVPCDQSIDENCPDCHPMPSKLLQSLRSNRRRSPTGEKSTNETGTSEGSREEIRKTPERTEDFHISSEESNSNLCASRAHPKPKISSKVVSLFSKQTVNNCDLDYGKRIETNNIRFGSKERVETRRPRENMEKSSRKRPFDETDDDDDRRRRDWERDGKRPRTNGHRNSYEEDLDRNSSNVDILYLRDQDYYRTESRHWRPHGRPGNFESGHSNFSTRRTNNEDDRMSRDPRFDFSRHVNERRSPIGYQLGGQDFDGRKFHGIHGRQRADRNEPLWQMNRRY